MEFPVRVEAVTKAAAKTVTAVGFFAWQLRIETGLVQEMQYLSVRCSAK